MPNARNTAWGGSGGDGSAQAVGVQSYTTATRPPANTVPAGTVIYVSDAAANNKLQYSDGSSWIVAG